MYIGLGAFVLFKCRIYPEYLSRLGCFSVVLLSNIPRVPILAEMRFY